MANRYRGTIYVGVTNDLVRRVYEHKNELADGFTKRYGLKSLVYYETLDGQVEAISREKQLKNWKREWKFDLIEKANPEWRDVYPDICV